MPIDDADEDDILAGDSIDSRTRAHSHPKRTLERFDTNHHRLSGRLSHDPSPRPATFRLRLALTGRPNSADHVANAQELMSMSSKQASITRVDRWMRNQCPETPKPVAFPCAVAATEGHAFIASTAAVDEKKPEAHHRDHGLFCRLRTGLRRTGAVLSRALPRRETVDARFDAESESFQ